MEEWTIKIIDVGYKFEKDVYIFRRLSDGKVQTLSGEVFDDTGIINPKPTLSLTNNQLRSLAEAINNQGINPQKEFTEGKLEATKKQLELPA